MNQSHRKKVSMTNNFSSQAEIVNLIVYLLHPNLKRVYAYLLIVHIFFQNTNILINHTMFAENLIHKFSQVLSMKFFKPFPSLYYYTI